MPPTVEPDPVAFRAFKRRVVAEALLVATLLAVHFVVASLPTYALLASVVAALYLGHVRTLWRVRRPDFYWRVTSFRRLSRAVHGQPPFSPADEPLVESFWMRVLPASVLAPLLLTAGFYAFFWVASHCDTELATGRQLTAAPLEGLFLLIALGYLVYTARRTWTALAHPPDQGLGQEEHRGPP
jgi:hypothetical protein